VSQTYRVHTGDVLAELKQYPDNHFDALLSDPPYGLEFMGKGWDKGVPPAETWAEVLRVLKPGAFALVFGGTRTYHRLACAIEDAGFEVRDCLMWLYGSGFPKSHNIGKAIDKERKEDEPHIYAVTAFVAVARDSAGLANGDIDAHFGTCGMAGHWTSSKSQPAVPKWDQWLSLKSLLNFGDSMDAEVWRLNGRKGKPGDNWERREVVGEGLSGIGTAFGDGEWAQGPAQTFDITAPATPAAALWEGQGTALKPAWEPVLLVRKPSRLTNAQNALEHGCGGLNIEGCRVGSDTISVHNAPAGTLAGGEPGRGSDTSEYREHAGRWPANLILDEAAADMLDEQSGERPGGNYPATRGAAVATDFAGGQATEGGARKMGDKGGASRFFQQCTPDDQAAEPPGLEDACRFKYTAKVNTKERNAGCDGLAALFAPTRGNGIGGKEHDPETATPKRNGHPTLKPISLTTYLAKLLLPPTRTDGQPRRILVPFSGSGSEMIGALQAGWDEAVGIEQSDEYAAIAEARLAHWVPSTPPADAATPVADETKADLFS
jgi:DNA modification methylase